VEQFARRIRSKLGVLIAGICLTSVAQAGSRGTYIAGHYVISAPVSQSPTPDEAGRLAHQCARRLPGAFVVRGFGDSMMPLYPSGTFLVVRPQAYTTLQRGLTVVFLNRRRSIGHLLVAKTSDGWRTTGLNNRRPDYMCVNDRNIIGVVVAAFTPMAGRAVAMR
jgi:phage repressor protein C with HTH and peptisase S24 domain